jgi:alkylation response protein AidB-like acyl-CoA dehydrogenase
VTALDSRADPAALRAHARELATALRAYALTVDSDPDGLADQLDAAVFQQIARYSAGPLDGVSRTVMLIELARGDAGTVLACPGPALAGVVVGILGDEEQNERLAAAVAGGRTWGFLAITEPGAGSDVTRLASELRPDADGAHLLYGEKRYIGNGSRGTVGVVLARTGPGPLALRAALVLGATRGPNLRTAPLDTVGLRGAQISEMTFDGLPVAAADLLGRHLSPSRRGMWGVRQAFNTVRIQVAAMALGTAMGVYDYVRAQRREWSAAERSEIEIAEADIEAVRVLILDAAAALDRDRQADHHAATAKLVAVRLARRLTAGLPRLLGRGALLEHPLLEKWRRDSAAFEFMEGTSHIQTLHIARHRVRAARNPGRAR